MSWLNLEKETMLFRFNVTARTMASFYAVSCVLSAMLICFNGTAAKTACLPPPTPVTNLKLVRYYTDKAGTHIDPALKRQNKTALKPLKRFVSGVAQMADSAVRYQSQGDADCALSWLKTWAQAGAYLGTMTTKQAEYQRKWDLSGTSLAYLKVKKFASSKMAGIIEPWLKAWAEEAKSFFDKPGHKRNNHWYWLGLGLGAVALATSDEPMWQQARSIFLDAMADIRSDGTLAFERARGKRALHYHTFALTPLIVMAELARAKGEDWYQGEGTALHRLVKRVAMAHSDIKVQSALAEPPIKQVKTKPGAGWLALYQARFPKRVLVAPLGVKSKHRWLGGDVNVLSRVVEDMANAHIKPTPQHRR